MLFKLGKYKQPSKGFGKTPRHPSHQVDAHAVGPRGPAPAPGLSAAPPQTGSQCPGARLGRDAPLLCPQGHTQGTCAAAMSPQWLFSPRKWGSVGCLLPMDTSGGMSNLQIPSDSWKRLPKSMCVQTHTHVHILRTPRFHCSWPVLLSYPDLSP